MKTKKKIMWIVGVLLLFIGCSDDKKPDVSGKPFEYPLAVGNFWEIEKTLVIEGAQSESESTPPDTFHHNGAVSILRQETILDTVHNNWVQTYCFESLFSHDDMESVSYEFYNNTDEGLISYGYIGESMITPKGDDKKGYLMYLDRKFDNVSSIISWLEGVNSHSKEKSLVYSPALALSYPLQNDKQWTYRTLDNNERLDKKVIEWVTVETAAGSYQGWKIQWILYENDRESLVLGYEYVGEIGLLKRELEFTNIEQYGIDGDYLGNFDCQEFMYIKNYSVN